MAQLGLDILYNELVAVPFVYRPLAIPKPALNPLLVGGQYVRAKGRLSKLKGVKRIAEGSFGCVYTHPTDTSRVVKVGRLRDSWLVWAAMIDMIKPLVGEEVSKHFPVIHSIKRFEKQGVYIAEIERLEETVLERNVRLFREQGAAAPVRWDDGVCAWFRHLNEDYADAAKTVLDQLNASVLFPILKLASEFAAANNMVRDLHDANAMLRADGTLVITDPFSGDPTNGQAALKRATGRDLIRTITTKEEAALV